MNLIDRESLLEKIQFRIEPFGVVGATIKDCVEKTREIILAEPVVTETNVGSKWIPASELPETDDEVFVWFEYFRYGSYNRMFRTIGIGRKFRNEWSGFVNGESGWHKLKILAWMPLPEPPEEAE